MVITNSTTGLCISVKKLCRPARLLFACVAVGLSAVGCSGSDAKSALTADAPALAGLPAAVVAERLADPELQWTLANPRPWTAESIAQLNVARTVLCRDSLRAYQSWVATGIRPAVPESVRPDRPERDFNATMAGLRAEVREAIDSGDPAALSRWLSSEDGCWSTIADPAQSATQTIEGVFGVQNQEPL